MPFPDYYYDIFEDFEDSTLSSFTETDPNNNLIYPSTEQRWGGTSSLKINNDGVARDCYISYSPSGRNNISIGFALRTGSNSDNYEQGAKIFNIGRFTYSSEGFIRLYEGKSAVNNNRQISIAFDGSSIVSKTFTVIDNTWYWITVQYNRNAISYAQIYDKSHNLLADFSSDVKDYQPDFIEFGRCGGNYVTPQYIDNIVVDYTYANFPLLGWQSSLPTLTEIADAVWTRTERTLDAQSPALSNGTYLDDVAYAVWTRSQRTVDSAGNIITAEIVETINVIDSSTSTAILVSSCNESNSIIDLTNKTAILSVSEIEPIAAADNVNKIAILQDYITEATSIVDISDRVANLPILVIESASSIDTCNGVRIATPISANIIETISASDTQSTINIAISSIIESQTLIDTTSTFNIARSTIIENNTAIDTLNKTSLVPVTQIENNPVLESSNTTYLAKSSILENINVIDITNSLKITNSVINETNAAIDSTNAATSGIVQSVSITESLIAIDTLNSTSLKSTLINEASLIIDTSGSNCLIGTSLTETTTTLNNQTNTLNNFELFIESSNAVENIDCTRIVPVNVFESVTAVDIINKVAFIVANIVEVSPSQETSSCLKYITSSIIESGNVTDIVSCITLAIHFWNNIKVSHNYPAEEFDLKINLGNKTIGIPLIPVSESKQGAIRIKINGETKALKQQ